MQYLDIKIENDVIIGKNDWLYLYMGTNNLFKYYTDNEFFTAKNVEAWTSILLERKKNLSNINCLYYHIFVPDKITIYPENIGKNIDYKTFSKGPIEKTMSENALLEEFVINPIKYFMIMKSKRKLYWKTDTHWTFWGAYSAFEILANKLDFNIPNDFLNHEKDEVKLDMDLGSKLKPIIYENISFHKFMKKSVYTYKNTIVKNNEKNGISKHVGSHVIFLNKSEEAIKKKVIIFGDSFSEYRPYKLTAMISEIFSEVHFIWSTSLDYEYITKENPDIVISEIAERFMNIVPSDKFNLSQYLTNEK